MQTKKSQKTLIAVIAVILVLLFVGIGIYLLTKGEKKEVVELTAYSCDETTRQCNIVSGTTQAVIGSFDKATHFSLEVTATPTGSRNIINFRIMSDTETPGTTINPNPTGTPGTNAFYESLKNNQATPTQSGATANPYSWDTANTCSTDANCDTGAGEQCMNLAGNNICLIHAGEYVGGGSIDYTFTASIETEYGLLQGGTGFVEDSASKVVTISPDLTSGDLFSIQVSESPLIV